MGEKWNRRSGRSSSWLRRSTRFAIYARDGFDCVYCHAIFPPALDGLGLTVDHIVPQSLGGKHDPGNLVTACGPCNSLRQDRPLPPGVVRRLKAWARRPLNRELGRVLADLYESVRDLGTAHPLTRRVMPKRVSFTNGQTAFENIL